MAARGFLFAAALESALKVREAALLNADGYSTADLLHGPIAAIHAGAPALLLRLAGADGPRRGRGARPPARAGGRRARPSAAPELPEALAPIPAAVYGQQLAHALALPGAGPDAPRGLSKVTKT